LGEVANVLEDAGGASFTTRFPCDLLAKGNIVVEAVDAGDYLVGALLARERGRA